MMQLIDGKRIANEIMAEIKLEVEAMKLRGLRAPHLAAILVGSDGASDEQKIFEAISPS